MLIRKLQIKDIKNYTEHEFDFSNGIIAICGPNGSGKTTIIESIAWALFDHLDYKKEDFVRRGARKGSVNVFFVSNIDGREYGVSRDSTGSYYVYDPELNIRLAQQKQEVTKWLCQQHGVEDGTDLSNLFRTTIGVPQGSFTYDFLQPPSKRKPVFDKILKVEDYIHAADKFKDLSRLIEGKISAIREKIASDEGQLKHFEEIESNYQMAIDKLASLKYLYDDAKLNKQITEIRLSQLETLKTNIDKINQQIHQLKLSNIENETKGKNLIAEIQRAKQASELVNKAKIGYEKFLLASEKLKVLEKSRTTRDQLRNSYSSTEQQISRLESDIEHTQQELKQIEKAHQELTNLTTKVQEQEELEKQLQDLQKKVGEKEQVERNISNLGRDLDDLRQKYSEVSRSIEDSEKHKNDDKLVTKLELEKSEIDQRLANYNLTLTELKHKEEQLNNIINTYQNLDLQIKRNFYKNRRLTKGNFYRLAFCYRIRRKAKRFNTKNSRAKSNNPT
ncbi:MAG: SMC family ATPase [Blastocatellia bacterium]|nr:SMC family ATPase [Blastocatellia bacterium]